MTGAPGITLTLEALASIPGSAGTPTTPTLVIRCHEGKLDAYVHVGRVVAENRGVSLVRVRYDSATATPEEWKRSTDLAAVFAPDPGLFLRGAISDAHTFRIEVQPFDAVPLVIAFVPKGIRSRLPSVQQSCPTYRLDENMREADRRITHLMEVIQHYSRTSVENKRLGVSLKWTAINEATRIANATCRIRVLRTTTGAGAGRHSFELDMSAVQTPITISDVSASSGAYARILLRPSSGADGVELVVPSRDAAQALRDALSAAIQACDAANA